MAAYYYNTMPNNIEEIEAMTFIYFEKLKNYESSLVLQNFEKHIEHSRFLPTIADLVKVEKKEESVFDRVPNAIETRQKFLQLEAPVINAATKEEAEFYKQQIKKKLQEAQAKYGNERTYNPFS